MAEPISNSVSPGQQQMPSQDDPANYQWWADWHDRNANEIAALAPGPTEGERLGQLQGELDHRASAETFRGLIERGKDASYNEKARQELIERGVLSAANGAAKPAEISRAEVLEDTQAAFRDLGIPEELAGHAVTVGNLTNMQDAGDREAFYLEIASARADLDDRVNDNGTTREVEGINDWKSAIEAAGARFEKRQDGPAQPLKDPNLAHKVIATTRQLMDEQRAEAADRKTWKDFLGHAASTAQKGSDIRSGLAAASSHWSLTNQDVRRKFPLLTNDRDAEKIASAGRWRASLIARIPADWHRRLGLDAERTYNNAVAKAYDKLIDKQRDALLLERTKALVTLRGVDTRVPPHLLPSKQYRAAERLTRIDQQLRSLSPLDKGEYGAAVNAAAAPQKAVQVAAEQSTAKAPAQAPERVNENVRVIQVTPQVTPQVGPTKHELALQAVRELRAQTPVDGWRSKAAEAMANRIVQQLQEGRDTVSLSTKYAGGDQGQAASTHANAVESNKQLIEAVRQHGIPVDTGKAALATVKKAEVELGSQVEQDQIEPNLQ